jgi:hypothetical protein
MWYVIGAEFVVPSARVVILDNCFVLASLPGNIPAFPGATLLSSIFKVLMPFRNCFKAICTASFQR